MAQVDFRLSQKLFDYAGEGRSGENPVGSALQPLASTGTTDPAWFLPIKDIGIRVEGRRAKSAIDHVVREDFKIRKKAGSRSFGAKPVRQALQSYAFVTRTERAWLLPVKGIVIRVEGRRAKGQLIKSPAKIL